MGKTLMGKPSLSDSAFYADLAARCFDEAAHCGNTTAAIGLRELGEQYLEMARQLEATDVLAGAPAGFAARLRAFI
jgi:hypothetical protein